MPSSSIAILVGHTGRDPEMKYIPTKNGGAAVTKSSIAVDTGYGERKKTTWWELEIWGKTAENFNLWVKKGNLIQVIGEAYEDQFTRRDGTEGKKLVLKVQSFTSLDKHEGGPSTYNSSQTSESDDMPF